MATKDPPEKCLHQPLREQSGKSTTAMICSMTLNAGETRTESIRTGPAATTLLLQGILILCPAPGFAM